MSANKLLQLNVKNLKGVQQQLEDEINIMTDLLDQTTTEPDIELYTTYDATIALQSELTPLLDRVHSLGLFPFVQRLTPMEKLTLERLGFKILPDASSASSFLNNQKGTANHYSSENASEEPAPLLKSWAKEEKAINALQQRVHQSHLQKEAAKARGADAEEAAKAVCLSVAE